MKSQLGTVVIVAVFAAAGEAQRPSDVPVDSATTAFVGVTVVPMDSERRLVNHVVVIRNGRIVDVGPEGVTPIPNGARRIDGRGRFLMPALTDMHVHLAPYTSETAARAARVMPLLLANGITVARSMVGHASHPALREAVRTGAVIAPRLVLAAPQITGPGATGSFRQFTVPTAVEARERVRQARDSGFDFVKITFGLTSHIHDAIASATRDFGLPLSGHVTPGISFQQVATAKQQVEHLDGYLEATVADGAPVTTMGNQAVPGAILRYLDPAKIGRIARSTREAGVANTPTLALFQVAFIDTTSSDSLLRYPGTEYFQPQTIEAMRQARASFLGNVLTPAEDREAYGRFRNAMTKALTDSGALVLAGSDSPQHFQMIGFALHRELEALVRAGLTPFQALAAATINPAIYLGVAESFGTVAVGKQADLLLLDADPLASVSSASRPAGVMLAGRWYSSVRLSQLMHEAKP